MLTDAEPMTNQRKWSNSGQVVMKVLPQKRLSIVDNKQPGPERSSFESINAANQGGGVLDQTFAEQQPRSAPSSSNGVGNERSSLGVDTVMWGYSPNFNLK